MFTSPFWATRSPDLALSLAALLDEDKIVKGGEDQKRYELEKTAQNLHCTSAVCGCIFILLSVVLLAVVLEPAILVIDWPIL